MVKITCSCSDVVLQTMKNYKAHYRMVKITCSCSDVVLQTIVVLQNYMLTYVKK
jgi:hypothetical protein